VKHYRKASDEILKVLASNTRYFRFKRGWTQAELAKLCGFRPNYIGGVERAKINITLANIETLANGLGISEYDMLDKDAIEDDLRKHSTRERVLSRAATEYAEKLMVNQ
jgi:transcriptional regulator with XRE-family HTH domain